MEYSNDFNFIMPDSDPFFLPEISGFTDQEWWDLSPLFADDVPIEPPVNHNALVLNQLLADEIDVQQFDEGFKSEINPMCDHELGDDSREDDDSDCAFFDLLDTMLGTLSNLSSVPPTSPESQSSPNFFLPVEEAHVSDRQLGKKRKRSRWTAEEHELFLKGIEVYGDGHWKSISKEFVKTRTHIQIASHAQKYYLYRRQSDGSNVARKKRKSIYDVTTDHIRS